MIESGYLDLPDKEIRMIKSPPRHTMTKMATGLRTPEEIQTLLEACIWSRDRYLFDDLVQVSVGCSRVTYTE